MAKMAANVLLIISVSKGKNDSTTIFWSQDGKLLFEHVGTIP